MVPNAGFWAHFFRRVYVPAIEGFRTGALEKVVPAFSGIEEEAYAAAEAEFERLGSMPAGSMDIGDVAESAFDLGIEYYETMWGVQQGMLNLIAVGLHHLFEQQKLYFLRRELATEDDQPFRVFNPHESA